ncbi:MAG TPA: alpha/beta hydrolase [Vicinamibacterales bacterium]|jgi:3-oxoadipate enol-lactonase
MPIAACNGIHLYHELHGREDAPVVVLNNGILMNAAASWRPQTAALSARYRVLQYDCRGQGQSDHPDGPYSMALHADDLAALLTTLGIDRAHILGISYGGEVAQAFALDHPDRVLTLILADTVSEVGPELRLIVAGWRAAALSGDPDLFFLVTAPWNFSPAFIEASQHVLSAARARYRDLDLPAVARLCEAFDGVDFTARLPAIDVPTCVIVGEADLLKGPRYAGILHRAIAGSELHVLPGTGHAATWEAAAAFNEVVLDFLSRNTACAPPPAGR